MTPWPACSTPDRTSSITIWKPCRGSTAACARRPDYRQSLEVLAFARRHSPDVLTKSGFMVGLGETAEEVHALLRDLHASGTDVATIGQYLQPTRRNLAVAAFIEPRQFDEYRDYGLSLGFKAVFSGPLVRSSYMADEVSDEARRALVLNWALALASAALLILTFPRFDIVWLAPVALAPLLVALAREPRPWRRFLLGWGAGIVYWFGVCYWIQFVLAFHGGLGEAARLGRLPAVLPGEGPAHGAYSRCSPAS